MGNKVPPILIAPRAGNKVPADARPIVSLVEAAKLASGADVKSVHEKTPGVIGAQTKTLTLSATPSKEPVVSAPPGAYLHVRLMLMTLGQVAWGFLQEITPVASGKGRLLVTNLEQEIWLPPATRLYLASTGINRVGLTVEPMPFLNEILNAVRALGSK